MRIHYPHVVRVDFLLSGFFAQPSTAMDILQLSPQRDLDLLVDRGLVVATALPLGTVEFLTDQASCLANNVDDGREQVSWCGTRI